MKLARRALLVAAVIAAALSFTANAGAAIVTLGANLAVPFESEACGETCTLLNTDIKQPGGKVLAPSDGVILRWHVVEGLTPGEYHLRMATRAGALATYSFVTSSPGVQSAAVPGIQTFNEATPVPIKSGQPVALEMSPTASVGLVENEAEAGSFAEWAPNIADGVTQQAQTLGGGTIGYNVEMQPAPKIGALNVISGVSTGGTPVTITGTDFEGASAVSFGGVPSTAFGVDSESEVTADAPPEPAGSVVPVTITTIAGTATSSQTFTYTAPPVYCVVPSIYKKKLAAAKAALVKSKCTLGKVTKVAGATAKNGKVTRQLVPAGAQLPVGSKVGVIIKPIKPVTKPAKKRKKHGHKN